MGHVEKVKETKKDNFIQPTVITVKRDKSITSRDRPKSAPYPRLKSSKKTSKCQVFFYSRKSKIFRNFFLLKKNYILKKWTEWRANVSQCRKTERGDPLMFFNIHSAAKHEFFFGKKPHNAKKN